MLRSLLSLVNFFQNPNQIGNTPKLNFPQQEFFLITNLIKFKIPHVTDYDITRHLFNTFSCWNVNMATLLLLMKSPSSHNLSYENRLKFERKRNVPIYHSSCAPLLWPAVPFTKFNDSPCKVVTSYVSRGSRSLKITPPRPLTLLCEGIANPRPGHHSAWLHGKKTRVQVTWSPHIVSSVDTFELKS